MGGGRVRVGKGGTERKLDVLTANPPGNGDLPTGSEGRNIPLNYPREATQKKRGNAITAYAEGGRKEKSGRKKWDVRQRKDEVKELLSYIVGKGRLRSVAGLGRRKRRARKNSMEWKWCGSTRQGDSLLDCKDSVD